MNLYADTNQPVDSNVPSWMDFAQLSRDQGGLGLAPHQAAGLVGNLVQESGPQLTPWGPSGDNGSAWGTAQWRGDRLTGMQDFAKANNMDPKSVQAQQAWMRHEFDTTHADAYNQLSKAATPEDAATAVNQYYERSADKSGQREANARALFAGKPLGSVPALSFANQDDDSEDSTDATSGPLSTNKTLGPGALHRIIAGDDGKGSDSKYDAVAQGLTGIGASLAGITSPAQAYALNQQLAQMRNDSKSKYKYMVTTDGRMVRTDDSGNVDATDAGTVGSKGAAAKRFTFMKQKGDDGAERIVTMDNTTGLPVGGAGSAPSAPIGGDPNLQGQDRYQSMTQDERNMIDGWYHGTGVNPSTISMRNPKVMKLMEAAQAVYGPENMDFAKYGERSRFFQGMASKSPTNAGGQFVMAPTVLDHLDNVANDYHHMKNTVSSLPNGIGTEIGNAIGNTVGGQPRKEVLTSADNNSDTAAKEITSFLTRGHGGVSERSETHEKLYLPNASPGVQAAALEAYRKQVSDRFFELLDGSKGSVGEKNPELAKVAETFQKKDEALQQKIAKLKKGEFISDGSAAPAASGLPQGWTVQVK